MPTGRLWRFASASPSVGGENSTLGFCFAGVGCCWIVSTDALALGFAGFSSFDPGSDSSVTLGNFSSDFTLDEDFFFFGELGGLLFRDLDVVLEL